MYLFLANGRNRLGVVLWRIIFLVFSQQYDRIPFLWRSQCFWLSQVVKHLQESYNTPLAHWPDVCNPWKTPTSKIGNAACFGGNCCPWTAMLFSPTPWKGSEMVWFLKSQDGKMGPEPAPTSLHHWSEKHPWMAENKWVSLKLFHLEIGVITNPLITGFLGHTSCGELAFCLPRIKKRPQLIEILGVKNLHQIQFMTFWSLSWTFKGSRFHHPKGFWHWGKDFSSWMFG